MWGVGARILVRVSEFWGLVLGLCVSGVASWDMHLGFGTRIRGWVECQAI